MTTNIKKILKLRKRIKHLEGQIKEISTHCAYRTLDGCMIDCPEHGQLDYHLCDKYWKTEVCNESCAKTEEETCQQLKNMLET